MPAFQSANPYVLHMPTLMKRGVDGEKKPKSEDRKEPDKSEAGADVRERSSFTFPSFTMSIQHNHPRKHQHNDAGAAGGSTKVAENKQKLLAAFQSHKEMAGAASSGNGHSRPLDVTQNVTAGAAGGSTKDTENKKKILAMFQSQKKMAGAASSVNGHSRPLAVTQNVTAGAAGGSRGKGFNQPDREKYIIRPPYFKTEKRAIAQYNLCMYQVQEKELFTEAVFKHNEEWVHELIDIRKKKIIPKHLRPSSDILEAREGEDYNRRDVLAKKEDEEHEKQEKEDAEVRHAEKETFKAEKELKEQERLLGIYAEKPKTAHHGPEVIDDEDLPLALLKQKKENEDKMNQVQKKHAIADEEQLKRISATEGSTRIKYAKYALGPDRYNDITKFWHDKAENKNGFKMRYSRLITLFERGVPYINKGGKLNTPDEKKARLYFESTKVYIDTYFEYCKEMQIYNETVKAYDKKIASQNGQLYTRYGEGDTMLITYIQNENGKKIPHTFRADLCDRKDGDVRIYLNKNDISFRLWKSLQANYKDQFKELYRQQEIGRAELVPGFYFSPNDVNFSYKKINYQDDATDEEHYLTTMDDKALAKLDDESHKDKLEYSEHDSDSDLDESNEFGDVMEDSESSDGSSDEYSGSEVSSDGD